MYAIQNMQSVVYNHAYNVLRNKDLPPYCVDTKAMFDAQSLVNEYTYKGLLNQIYARLAGGAL